MRDFVRRPALPPDRWTIRSALGWTTEHFETGKIDAPRLTAELLLGHVLGLTRVQLYMDLDRPLQPAELKPFGELVRRRDAREPTQHLLGAVEFCGRTFRVDGRALIPRPETELLAEACLARIPKDQALRGLEVGIGSGVLALTLLAERPLLSMVATELSSDAQALAIENAAALGVSDRLDLRWGDLFASLAGGERFDFLAANPPYVATDVIATLEPEVRDHDPAVALDGGADGLDVLRRLIAGAPRRLNAGGFIALEIGDEQGDPVRALLVQAGFLELEIRKDYARLDRIAIASRA